MSESLEDLKNKIKQLEQTLQAFSGQIRARKQMADELYEANINLRSLQLLTQDQVNSLSSEIDSLKIELEKEKQQSSKILKEDEC